MRSLRLWTCVMSSVTGAWPIPMPPLLGAFHDLQRVGVLEKRFGGNAAPQQTGAAERLLLLDDGDFQPKLRCPDGRDIAAGAGADNDEIVLILLSHGGVCCRTVV